MSELDRKVFVGGLSPRTNSESLGAAFGKYGKILESNVIMDKLSGNSKGYGFVIFAKGDDARTSVSEGYINVDGKTCNCNLSGQNSNTSSPRMAIPNNGHNTGRNRNQMTINNSNNLKKNETNITLVQDSESFKQQVAGQMQAMYSDIQSLKFEISLITVSMEQMKQNMIALKQSMDNLALFQAATSSNQGVYQGNLNLNTYI